MIYKGEKGREEREKKSSIENNVCIINDPCVLFRPSSAASGIVLSHSLHLTLIYSRPCHTIRGKQSQQIAGLERDQIDDKGRLLSFRDPRRNNKKQKGQKKRSGKQDAL